MRCCEPLPISSLRILLLLTVGLWGAEVTIVLKPSVVGARELRVGDVATIQTKKRALARYIASLALPSSTLADGVIRPKEIESLLASNAIDTKEVEVRGNTRLYKKEAKVSKESVEEAIRRFMATRFPNYRIKRISFDFRPVELGSGRYRIEIRPLSKSYTHIYLNVEIFDGERLVKRMRATLYTDYYERCAVSAKPISKGHIIDASDIGMRMVKVRSSAQECLKPRALIGSIAQRNIPEGRLLKRFYVEPNYLVKRRKSVKIIYHKGPIRIELMGLALQNGNRGDIIKVKNLSSNKVLRCEVISRGVVRFVY